MIFSYMTPVTTDHSLVTLAEHMLCNMTRHLVPLHHLYEMLLEGRKDGQG